MKTKRDRVQYFKEYSSKIKEKKKEYDKLRYTKNKEDIKEKSKKYRELNKEQLTKSKNEYLSNNYEKVLFRSAKNRAKEKGLTFNIEITDIVIPEVCPYLGIVITKELGKGKVWSNASLDRIDNSKGYIKGNIEVISIQANIMKHQATPEQLTKFAISLLFRLAPEKLKETLE